MVRTSYLVWILNEGNEGMHFVVGNVAIHSLIKSLWIMFILPQYNFSLAIFFKRVFKKYLENIFENFNLRFKYLVLLSKRIFKK